MNALQAVFDQFGVLQKSLPGAAVLSPSIAEALQNVREELRKRVSDIQIVHLFFFACTWLSWPFGIEHS